MRSLALVLALALSGCISVHPAELPRLEGHGHGGTAFHSDCGSCAQIISSFVDGRLAAVLARALPQTVRTSVKKSEIGKRASELTKAEFAEKEPK